MAYQQPPPKPRGGILKWGLWGCVGAFALVGFLVVGSCVLIFASLSTDDDLRPLLTGDAPDLVVRITGSEGLAFSGALGALGSSRSVEGIVPAQYSIPGTDSSGIFSVSFQKQQEEGTLIVTLACRGGDKSSETTAAYGVVAVTC